MNTSSSSNRRQSLRLSTASASTLRRPSEGSSFLLSRCIPIIRSAEDDYHNNIRCKHEGSATFTIHATQDVHTDDQSENALKQVQC